MSLDVYLLVPGASDIRNCVFHANITHNLAKMAKAAGIYEVLWRPEELTITHAHELVEELECGLELLENDPELFKQYNPANGWGNYEVLVEFVRRYLAACKDYPKAEVRVSR